MENWGDFLVGYQLYHKDRLHLNGKGAALLGGKMDKKLEILI